MKKYNVDLSSLDPGKREEACNLLRGYSFFVGRVIGENGIQSAIVYWTSQEDFESCPAFPKGCPYTCISE